MITDRQMKRRNLKYNNCLCCKTWVHSSQFRKVTQKNFDEWSNKLKNKNFVLKIGRRVCAECWETFGLKLKTKQIQRGFDGNAWSRKSTPERKLHGNEH